MGYKDEIENCYQAYNNAVELLKVMFAPFRLPLHPDHYREYRRRKHALAEQLDRQVDAILKKAESKEE